MGINFIIVLNMAIEMPEKIFLNYSKTVSILNINDRESAIEDLSVCFFL